MEAIGHEASEGVGADNSGDLVDVNEGDLLGEGAGCRADAEGGEQREGGVTCLTDGRAAAGEHIDELARGALVEPGKAEVALRVAQDEAAEGVRGDAGGGGVEQREARGAVAGGISGEEIDVRASDLGGAGFCVSAEGAGGGRCGDR